MAAVVTACTSDTTSAPTSSASGIQSSAESQTQQSDTFPEEKVTAEDLPKAVDLRDYNGKNYVTAVKRQAFGDCWSFGNIAAAESSYLYENDLGVPAGEVNNNVNFSERYMSWTVFHSITKDDVKLGKVRQSQVGEGYDMSEAEERSPNAAFFTGAAGNSGSILFASGFGPVDEMTQIDGKYPYAYSDKNAVNTEDYEDYSASGDWSIPLNAEYRNPPLKVLLRNGNILPSPSAKDSNGNYVLNEDGLLAIKSEIAKGHAVGISVLSYGRMNYENWAAYTLADTVNHVVTIIGYDDSYPKENFVVRDSDGEISEDSTPPTDGAFIIKDSYGEVGGVGGTGTFYISYHDHTFTNPISFEFDKADSVKYTNLNYDQYDLMFFGACAYSDYENETKTANVFDAEEDEYLYQITYRTKQTNTSVHYAVYKDLTGNDPDSGTLLEEGDKFHWFGGSHKIDLKDTYELKKGDKYSIVLTMTYTNNDGKTTYTDVIPYAPANQNGAKPVGIINKGESFRFSGGKWQDMSEIREELSKKAFDLYVNEKMPEEYKKDSVEDVSIDNYPIKAILIPAGEYNK
ncbi:MAG: hypothetical protein IIT49_05270 [Clostridia bacterium]|nr:hypothetical protein [Clostridia bacterium]